MKCKYCDNDLGNYGGEICSTCRYRLPAAQELAKYLKVLRDYQKEQEKGENANNATELHRQP